MNESPYTVLVTGGAGFIGTHTCIALQEAGHKVVIYDNLSTSHPQSVERIVEITGQAPVFVLGDVQDQKRLEATLVSFRCNAVIHFAGLKAVGESVEKPLDYYDNNVLGSLALIKAMASCGLKKLVFSSSATVYGIPEKLPIKEDHSLSASNPYGRTKIIIEDILRELYAAGPDWHIAILRYFNPIGAHESGLIGGDPQSAPNNLMPFVSQVASGRRNRLHIWGNDYPTPDGTGVRDYIHVVDLALGHVAALDRLDAPRCFEVNLGKERGYSVLEMVRALQAISKRSIPLEIAPRRAGDVASCYADPRRARAILNWRAERNLDDMCRDAWRWQKMNPHGYAGSPSKGAEEHLLQEEVATPSRPRPALAYGRG